MERILIKNGRVFEKNLFVCKDIFTNNGVIKNRANFSRIERTNTL